ncbi:hypothetical protein [Natronobacterium gregoryi]|uniref:Uncharacterized protein n=2 Tax=Natronobacterium gregoryi TaxID=44930 RepID=L0AFR5_NATGS|nr:hypothetical protein [Natronobacterium gregoryi]AFZ72646.1 hypothetical protein Natgr_1435 [Natronobacterium gregoryi SP2]PLK19120.1 hypothetical protein CYV19_16695 [Natronobacterium gregoryi SP2]SFI90568.1 hypothetical protein SAMN05443661_10927 [Natronobacterium gregoryi]
MSKVLSVLASDSRTGARVKRRIGHSPQFSGVQTGDNGRPDRQVSPGGFLTGQGFLFSES